MVSITFSQVNKQKKRDMITEFTLKLKRLEVGQIEKTLMLKRTLKDGTINVRFSQIYSDKKPEPEHTGPGTKRHGDSIEHLYVSKTKISQNDNNIAQKKKKNKKEEKQQYQL